MPLRKSALVALAIVAAIVAGCAGDPNGSPLPTVTAPKKGKTLFVAAIGTSGAGSSCSSPYRVAAGANTADEIQETIDQAEDIGATTVHICAGDYVLEHRLVTTIALRIVGEGMSETVLDGNHEVTILEGGFAGSGSGRLELADITLQNGVAEALSFVEEGEGGIIMSGGAVTAWSLTTNRVAFKNNSGAACGGAVSLLSNIVALVSGAQLYDMSPRGREIYFNNTRSTFTDTTFVDNVAYLAGGAIGGLSLDLGELTDIAIVFYVESFFCGSPPMSVVGSTFTRNESLVGGAIYSVEPRTAMEIGEELWVDDEIARARPFTSRRMKELYANPSVVITSSHFTDNRSVSRNLLGVEDVPGIGGGAVFSSGVVNVSGSTFSGNGSPEVPIDDLDVTLEGGAITACGYLGTLNIYENNRAIAGGALAIGIMPFDFFYEFCAAGALDDLASFTRLDRYRNESFIDNYAEYAGGAIWSRARGRFSGAAGLRFSGNSGGGAQSVALNAQSCGTRDSVTLISSWERAGRFVEGATGQVTCDTDFSPRAARGTADRRLDAPLNLRIADVSALDLATLLQLRHAIEGFLHR